jgi:hypothetical protein
MTKDEAQRSIRIFYVAVILPPADRFPHATLSPKDAAPRVFHPCNQPV